MDQAVLAAMSTHRYTPALLDGRPVSVEYVFTLRLVLP
jgi:periplasmic protein TonB